MRTRSILCALGGAALVLGLAASPAAAAEKPSRERCISELAKAGRDVNLGEANFILGTEGNDEFGTGRFDRVDVFCGFGGNDIAGVFPGDIREGDIFLGGKGNDTVRYLLEGATFFGGAGEDDVAENSGTFHGGGGNDSVFVNVPTGTFKGGGGNDRVLLNYGTFNGGPGHDFVRDENSGVFRGGAGNDSVRVNAPTATFNGGGGHDRVLFNYGTFNGGPGNDRVGGTPTPFRT